jgi:hypothetical protein
MAFIECNNTSRGISGHLFIWHYCCFCVFWIGVVDCYRLLHPFFRVPHLKCKIRSDQHGRLKGSLSHSYLVV